MYVICGVYMQRKKKLWGGFTDIAQLSLVLLTHFVESVIPHNYFKKVCGQIYKYDDKC